MEKITRKNPESMPKPVGNYSHITRVPKGAGLFVTSGQVGTGADGQIPSSLNDQVTNTFENIKRILASEGLNEEHVIKVNIWATEEIDWDHLYPQWDVIFKTAYPSMTVAYVTALGWPELKIEIELWCADI
ncbi:RidA family protein [Bacillus altitudinis]|uniref:RidA family protein n=1 Tax=Bacillus altitudinis TaxID=293387 RepID=UPI002DBF7FC3|nr:RidA family protein [Bacillus altitudinis]MEC0968629.1 RidA family protein [Bacillus altitudinis]MEC1001439.1 RidA family protein [Bacillus altitudinis]